MRFMVCLEGIPDLPNRREPKAVVEVGACMVVGESIPVVYNYIYDSKSVMGKATSFTRVEKDDHAELYFDIEFDNEEMAAFADKMEVGLYATNLVEYKGEDGLRHVTECKIRAVSFFIGPIGTFPRWKDYV